MGNNTNKKKDWFTLTKILCYIVTFIVLLVVGFTFWVVINYEDTTPLAYIIPSTEALALAVWGLYIWRGRSEFKMKSNQELVKFLIENNVEVTPDMINAFNTID